MQMNSNLILAGQPVNALAALTDGTRAAGLAGQVGQQGDLMSLYRTQGAGIANGDTNALNALAALDPMASLGVQESRLGMDATRQTMRLREEDAQRARAAGARAAQTHAANMTALERQQEAAETRRLLGIAAPALERAGETGDMTEFNQMLRTAGLPPANTYEDALVMYLQVEGAVESLEQFRDLTAGPEADWQIVDGQYVDMNNPASGAQDIPGLRQEREGFRDATPEEAAARGAAAGQFGPDDRFYPLNPPNGMSISSDGRGGFTLSQGPGVGNQDGQMDIASPEAMIGSIDGILNDPALDSATGMLAWTSNIPGTAMRGFGARADQLDGQAFLQAYNSLRGAGQITEFESQQALRAVGRLDRAQSPEDYRAALLELRNILQTGSSRPRGWAQRQPVDDGGQGVPFSTEGAGDIPVVRSQQDYDLLLPGMVYRDPDGNLRQRPEQGGN